MQYYELNVQRQKVDVGSTLIKVMLPVFALMEVSYLHCVVHTIQVCVPCLS